MTKEEILEFRKLCAKFLGGKLYTPKPWYYFPKYNEHYYFENRELPNRFTLNSMPFESDWNWIMEVVEAIERLKGIKQFHIVENSAYLNIENIGSFNNPLGKKEAVVESINKFLILYNEGFKVPKI